MSRTVGVLGGLAALVLVAAPAVGQEKRMTTPMAAPVATPAAAPMAAPMATPAAAPMAPAMATPADGHTVHVTAPHVVAGKVWVLTIITARSSLPNP